MDFIHRWSCAQKLLLTLAELVYENRNCFFSNNFCLYRQNIVCRFYQYFEMFSQNQQVLSLEVIFINFHFKIITFQKRIYYMTDRHGTGIIIIVSSRQQGTKWHKQSCQLLQKQIESRYIQQNNWLLLLFLKLRKKYEKTQNKQELQ